MSEETINILLVEDNQDYAWMLQLVLSELDGSTYNVLLADTLDKTIQILRNEKIILDIILLDLSLPDSQGYETFRSIQSLTTETPVIVMTAIDNKELALRAVRDGAQDFLVKGSTDVTQLVRSIHYAIERHRAMIELRRMSYVDELTGLLNRRGFLCMAEQQLKIANRANREMLLFFADMDGLKQINDNYGHQEGDNALKSIASILETTFRSSDLIARLGGDEFTILAIDAPKQNADQILIRLKTNIDEHNQLNPTFKLSMSVGVARFYPNEDIDLGKMLNHADRELYTHKNQKQYSR